MTSENTWHRIWQACKRASSMILLGCLLALVASNALAADKSKKLYESAVKLRQAGKLDQARLELQASLRLKPDSAKAKALLGLTCFQIGEQLKSQGNAASALAMFQEAAAVDPEEAYWHAALSQALRDAGDTENAANECAEAMRLSPLDALLAESCRSLGSARDTPEAFSKDGTQGFKPGTDMTPPVPEHKPEPPYSEKARKLDYHGVTVLYVIVDDQGSVERLGVLKPLGLGLDQQALKTVSGWKFRPATQKGKAVRVRVIIEVQFRLY